MDNVLIDTSAWIDYFGNRQNDLAIKVEHCVFNTEVCTCYPVVQEVLQGIRWDEQYQKTKTYLLDLKVLGQVGDTAMTSDRAIVDVRLPSEL